VKAITRLRELELRPAVEGCETDQAEQHGRVLAQEPCADSAVRRAQLVTLVVGQHPEIQPVSRHRRSHQSPLPSRGGSNQKRGDLATEVRSASSLAAVEVVDDDREGQLDQPIASPDPASVTVSLANAVHVGAAPGRGLFHPSGGVGPGAARSESRRDRQPRVARRRSTRRRSVPAAGALALLAAGLLVTTIVSVIGLHEVREPRPEDQVAPTRSAPAQRRKNHTRTAEAHGRVVRRRPARRKTPLQRARRLRGKDAGSSQPRPAARRPRTEPSSSALPAVASSPPAQPRTGSPAAIGSPRARALPPSPTGSLPGPPPT
jgi:hypothetical protein